MSVKSNGSQARDPEFQAMYVMRGVPGNAFDMSTQDVLEKNETFRNLAKAINAGCGDTFDITKCRFEKIILSSDADALLQDFQSAKDYRDSIAITNKGPIREIYELYLDLLDEAGGIATVATILASNHLSIKNIGIIHNREFEDGVLRLEMYDRISLDAAVQLLRKHHYTIYER